MRSSKRRLIVEIETVDTVPGAMLEIIIQIVAGLEGLKKGERLVDYGVALEHDVTWFVSTATDIDGKIEEAEE